MRISHGFSFKVNNKSIVTGVVGIEPTSKVLETFILPMNYTPKKHSLDIYSILWKVLSRKLEKNFVFCNPVGGTL